LRPLLVDRPMALWPAWQVPPQVWALLPVLLAALAPWEAEMTSCRWQKRELRRQSKATLNS
jgi:hypothetical protein